MLIAINHCLLIKTIESIALKNAKWFNIENEKKMPKEQYKVIVKVSPDYSGDNDSFLKYHVRDLLKFTNFLDEKHPSWKWFNVFDKDTREQLASYTVNQRPNTARI